MLQKVSAYETAREAKRRKSASMRASKAQEQERLNAMTSVERMASALRAGRVQAALVNKSRKPKMTT
jgi:hypothetical protein